MIIGKQIEISIIQYDDRLF